jgi:hypothetical protein
MRTGFRADRYECTTGRRAAGDTNRTFGVYPDCAKPAGRRRYAPAFSGSHQARLSTYQRTVSASIRAKSARGL